MVSAKGGACSPGNTTSIWDASRSYLRVVIRDLVTEARVGLHPWEQHPERPNRLVVNLELYATLSGSLQDESRTSIMDYDHIRDALREWPGRRHTPLLETLLAELVGLCFQSPRVEACRVSVMKPDIFNEAAAVGVEAYVLRADHGILAVQSEQVA